MASPSTRAAGTVLACVGASHFIAPGLYEPATMGAFPDNTRGWVYRNGTTELVLGLALRSRHAPLRSASIAGLTAYLLWLTGNGLKVVLGSR
jgi:hypothetical protein